MRVTIRCYYSDPFRGRVFEEIESEIESESRTRDGTRCGLASPAIPQVGAGYDWYEYPDGTLCHARRGA